MKSRKYKAILFDFDGTLYDTWPTIAKALQQTYQHYTGTEAGNIDHLKSYSILPRAQLVEKVFNKPATKEQITLYIENYKKIMLLEITPYSGTRPTIEQLVANEIPWGIVTSKPRQHIEILAKHISLLDSASCIICPEDVQNSKPHPESLLKACSLLALQPSEALYVGDTTLDIEAANSCNMDCALVLYGYINQDQLTPNHKVDYFIKGDLSEILEKCLHSK